MGIYRQATTVIGYEISTANFFEKKIKPNCSHNPPAGKHCPECGKSIGTQTVTVTKDEWWDWRDEFLNHLPDGYVSDSLYDDAGDKIWIGYGSTVSDEETVMLSTKSYDQIKFELARLLESYTRNGLIELDPTKFGIWTIFTGH